VSVIFKVIRPWGEDVMPICAEHYPHISHDKEGDLSN
jgi:hypothetical protein